MQLAKASPMATLEFSRPGCVISPGEGPGVFVDSPVVSQDPAVGEELLLLPKGAMLLPS